LASIVRIYHDARSSEFPHLELIYSVQRIIGLLFRSVEQSRWEQPVLDSDIVCTPCQLAGLTAHVMNSCTLKSVTAFIQSLESTNSPICLVHIGPCSWPLTIIYCRR